MLHRQKEMVLDKKHAKVMTQYVKLLGEYYLDVEAQYEHYNVERYADVLSFEHDEKSDKIVLILTEIKSFIKDVGGTIRQVKRSVISFQKCNKDFIHKMLEEAMLKLSKQGKEFVLGKEADYDVKGRLVVPLTKPTIQQIEKYYDLLKGIDTFFIAKDKQGKFHLINIQDKHWKQMELFKV